MSDLKALQYRAMQIVNHYQDYDRKIGRKGWDLKDFTDGLVRDVDNLVKAMVAVEEPGPVEESLQKVEYQLNNVLKSLLLHYRFYRIDPDESFTKAMDKLEKKLIAMKKKQLSEQPS